MNHGPSSTRQRHPAKPRYSTGWCIAAEHGKCNRPIECRCRCHSTPDGGSA